jgi:carbamoyl-phosphate synthase large subunit
VQVAVSPDEKEDIVAIEINPRVSRSSISIKSNGLSYAKMRLNLLWDTIWMNCKTNY